MMLTALFGGIFGALNALLPDVVGYFKKRQEMQERREERAHELDMLEKTAEVQLKIGAQKLDEVRVAGEQASVQAELVAHTEQMKAIYDAQKPIGIKWVDAWNAALRPAAVSVVLAVYFVGVTIYEASVLVLWWHGTISSGDVITHMFAGFVGESIGAVWGYLFGYRGTNVARSYAKGA